jgi:hypothetical protein
VSEKSESPDYSTAFPPSPSTKLFKPLSAAGRKPSSIWQAARPFLLLIFEWTFGFVGLVHTHPPYHGDDAKEPFTQHGSMQTDLNFFFFVSQLFMVSFGG